MCSGRHIAPPEAEIGHQVGFAGPRRPGGRPATRSVDGVASSSRRPTGSDPGSGRAASTSARASARVTSRSAGSLDGEGVERAVDGEGEAIELVGLGHELRRMARPARVGLAGGEHDPAVQLDGSERDVARRASSGRGSRPPRTVVCRRRCRRAGAAGLTSQCSGAGLATLGWIRLRRWSAQRVRPARRDHEDPRRTSTTSIGHPWRIRLRLSSGGDRARTSAAGGTARPGRRRSG